MRFVGNNACPQGCFVVTARQSLFNISLMGKNNWAEHGEQNSSFVCLCERALFWETHRTQQESHRQTPQGDSWRVYYCQLTSTCSFLRIIKQNIIFYNYLVAGLSSSILFELFYTIQNISFLFEKSLMLKTEPPVFWVRAKKKTKKLED